MPTKEQRSPLTFALIGCGRISVKHLKAVLKKNSGLTLCAIVDSNPDAPANLLLAAGLSEKKSRQLLSRVHVYADYEDMLQKEKPNVVAITVPSGLHYRFAKAALLSGAHVLLEKPMTMCVSEARELYDLSQSTGCKIAMGHIYRYLPIVANLQKDLAADVFGTLSHGTVCVRWGHDQEYYDQASWRGTWKSDGGALMNQSVHALDLLCWLMSSEAVSAQAMLARRFHDMEAEDVALGTLTLASHAICQIEGTTNTSPFDHEASFFIHGTKGTLRVGIRKGRPYFDIRDASGRKRNFYYLRKELREKGIRNLLTLLHPHAAIYQDLVAAIHENRNPIADAKSGYTSVEMVLAMYLAAREGRQVAIPLAADFASEDMKGFFV
jgi:UDP-N-acetyl-2-amino-2-deoxyglucuronate dehydrogenase